MLSVCLFLRFVDTHKLLDTIATEKNTTDLVLVSEDGRHQSIHFDDITNLDFNLQAAKYVYNLLALS